MKERINEVEGTIEGNKVSNNKRFESIEETLEKDDEKLSKTETDLKAQIQVNKDEILKSDQSTFKFATKTLFSAFLNLFAGTKWNETTYR